MSKPAKPSDKANDKAAAEPAGKKSPKKLILIAAVLVAVLGAGGAGAWFFLGGKDKTKEAKHQAVPPVFVNLEPFTVNLQPEEGEQYLQVTMVLQVKNDEAAESVKQHMPQVRSRLLMLLSSKKASEIHSAEGKHKLADEIVAQVKQPFSKDAPAQEVGSVFFTDLVIQ